MDKLLDIKIDNFKKAEIFQKIEFFLTEKKFHQIATINPEFVLEAQKNTKFKEILNACDLHIADGIGIQFAFFRFGKILKTRLTGIDLMLRILKEANRKKMQIFLAANKNGLSSWEETRDAIHKIYPQLKIDGENFDKNIAKYESQTVNQILFCNFGTPYQEYFLNSLKNGTIRLAMGVGGGFDFLTGKIRRAPKIMRWLGLEWFWRFLMQPWRWKRIINAVVIFTWKILLNKNN